MKPSNFSFMTFPLLLDRIIKTMSVEQTVKLAADNAIPYVDLMNLSFTESKRYSAAMQKHGVNCYCYIATVPFFKEERAVKEKLLSEMKKAALLQAKLFMIVPTGYNRCKKDKNRWFEIMAECFSFCVQESVKFNLTVCFETTPHADSGLCGAEECLAILKAVAGLGLVFDTANMLPCGEDPLEYYSLLKDYIIYVHLKDVEILEKGHGGKMFVGREYIKDGRRMQSCVYGRGITPLKEIYERMIADGYKGIFALEYCRPNGIAGYKKHDEHLKKFLEYFTTETV